jgi:mandelamide amidase
MASRKMNAFTEIVRPDLLGNTPFDKNMVFAVKANTGCGHLASAATPSLRDWVPKKKEGFSPVVQRLLDAGHQIAAITNMHELAFGITSENLAFGDVENPRKEGYIAGGSSGGSAAAVAMNVVSFALGTDTGGSMRIPAALCGVVGYRPTIELYSQMAVLPLSSTTDTIGIFARQVSTVQLAHRAIDSSYTPAPRPLSGVRIGVPRKYYYSVLDREVSQVTEAALKTLREAGAEVVECDINFPAGFGDMVKIFFDLVVYETGDLVPKFLEEQDAPVRFKELCEQIKDPKVRDVFTTANQIPPKRHHECQQEAKKIRHLLEEYFTTNNLEGFVIPTTILPAVKRPSSDTVTVGDQEFKTIYAYVHNAMPQAEAGVPCISIPSGLTPDGLPVGLELVGPRGSDSNVLNLAASIQAVMPAMPQLSFDNFKARL